MIHIFIAIFSAAVFHSAMAEIISIEPPVDAQFFNTPTTSLYFGEQNAQATLLVVTGGPGKPGFNPNTGDTKQQTVFMLRSMVDKLPVNEKINIAVFISPTELSEANRYSDEHLARVASTIDFYSKKNKQPIWLMGHSFGSISVTEVLNRTPQIRNSVAGLITSGSKNNISISPELRLPILFLHHEYDRCKGTTYRSAKNNYESAQKSNPFTTTLRTVSGGDDTGQPCSDGHHMFAGAYNQAGDYIAEFIQNNSK